MLFQLSSLMLSPAGPHCCPLLEKKISPSGSKWSRPNSGSSTLSFAGFCDQPPCARLHVSVVCTFSGNGNVACSYCVLPIASSICVMIDEFHSSFVTPPATNSSPLGNVSIVGYQRPVCIAEVYVVH